MTPRTHLKRHAAVLATLTLIATAALAEAPAAVAKATTAPATAAATKVADAVITTPSGLKYRDTQIGTGRVAKAGDKVKMHYTGWLQNPDGSKGQKFDSSLDRGQTFDFPLGGGRVIKGWDEGVAGMKQGGKRQLIIPPALGYGDRDVGGGLIPARSTLIFDVELVGF
jgi:FKBP-type peptidyl-prolyl cis-trans isomerase